MRSPSQALLWHAFSLSWPALLLQTAGAVAIVFLIDLALDPGEDSRSAIEAADLVLLIGVCLIFIVTLHGMQRSGGMSNSLGFPYKAEFTLPVPTATLLLVPLIYFCVLIQLALFIPGVILNGLLFNVEVSYLAISFVIFQLTVIPLMLTWWTQNSLASLAAWLLGLYLYAHGYLLPEFTRVEGSWIVTANAASDYLAPLLYTAAMGVLTYVGVKRQRSGEPLFSFGHSGAAEGQSAALRNIIPLPVSECPISSPLHAEIWKERQLAGEYRAIFGGLVGAAMTLIILGAISFFVPGTLNPVQPSNVALLSVALYLSVCVGLTAYMFGIRYRNGVAQLSVHDRTTALSTAQLTCVRVSVALSSTVLAGVVMATTLWIAGPYVIDDFAAMQTLFIDSLAFITQQGFAVGSLRLVLLLLAFLTGLSLLSVSFTWMMLYSRWTAIGLSVFSLYAFLVVTAIDMAVDEAADVFRIIDSTVTAHAWILLLAIPIGIVKMLRDLLHDWVITKSQLIMLFTAATVPASLNLVWVISPSHFDGLSKDLGMTALCYLVILGIFPLLAAILSLWTSNRLRHN